MRAPRFLAATALALAGACSAASPTPTREASVATALEEGQRELREGRPAEALPALRRALAADPRNLTALRGLIEAHFRLGRLDEVLAELEGQLKARPDDDTLHYGLGVAWFARASTEAQQRAVEHLSRATALAPDRAEYHFRLGIAHLEAERFAEAATSLRRARELDPLPARHHVPLALALSRTGDRKGAVEAVRAILDLSPSPQDLKVARTVMARITDPFREFPKAIEGAFQRGLDALDRLDSPQQAIVAFEEILEQFPDLAVVHGALGLAYQRIDDSGRAMDEYRRALELSPDDPRHHLYIADLYFSKERLDRAAEGYRAVLERDPLSDRAYERLGAIAVQRGNAEEAAGWFQRLVVLRPDDLEARKALAIALYGSGALDGAAREFEAILARAPQDAEAMLRLALVDVARSRRETDPGLAGAARQRAVERLEKVLDLQPQNMLAAKTLQELRPQ